MNLLKTVLLISFGFVAGRIIPAIAESILVDTHIREHEHKILVDEVQFLQENVGFLQSVILAQHEQDEEDSNA